ncbi:MAG TPA: hypothetical protein VJX67_26045 [Blastocatellia bacterium]|nr:hypothetical protein [Blastocatellia bacterium]
MTIVASEDHRFTLSDEDETALLLAIAEADRGEMSDAEEVLS